MEGASLCHHGGSPAVCAHPRAGMGLLCHATCRTEPEPQAWQHCSPIAAPGAAETPGCRRGLQGPVPLTRHSPAPAPPAPLAGAVFPDAAPGRQKRERPCPLQPSSRSPAWGRAAPTPSLLHTTSIFSVSACSCFSSWVMSCFSCKTTAVPCGTAALGPMDPRDRDRGPPAEPEP